MSAPSSHIRRLYRRLRTCSAILPVSLALLAGPAFADDPCEAAVWADEPLRDAPAIGAGPFAPVGASSLDADRQARLDAALAEAAPAAPAIGAALLFADGSLWQGVRGAPEEAVFQIASVTKPMIAVIVLRLVEAGQLSLDTPVSDFYPALPGSGAVTIDHLLRHTSGLHLDDFDVPEDRYTPRQAYLEALAQTELAFCPGSQWQYSNVGYRVLGGIVEQVDGRPLAEAVAAHIAGPLGLDTLHMPVPGERREQRVPAYHEGEPAPATDYASIGAAGGIAARPADVAMFWRAVLNAELVSEESRDLLFRDTAFMYGPGSISYGRGAMIFHPDGSPVTVYGHTGQMTGFSAALYYYREKGLIGAVIVNDRTVSSEDVLGALVGAAAADAP